MERFFIFLNFGKKFIYDQFITCSAKLLEFDWLRGMQLIRNCTGKIRAKTCNCDLSGCSSSAKGCNCYLIGYFCRARTCNSPCLDNFG